ncbi:MAG TPA: thioredoxin domain-containing protein [Chthonomonadaceae bacterium]|nr:thioredoxin domain-containing protein [Chthonomonadaceae bacterium]
MIDASRSRWRTALIYLTGPLVGGFFGLLFVLCLFVHKQQLVGDRKPLLLHTTRPSVIGGQRGLFGKKDAPFVLVEFADYQCGPCIATSQKIHAILAKYNGRLAFAFRNYPLTKIHQDALRLAVIAEAAGIQNHFWEMSEGLFALRGTVESSQLYRLVRASHLDRKRFMEDCKGAAARIVERDIADARALKLPGTPSLILCCPDGKVYLLHSLKQIAVLIEQPASLGGLANGDSAI